MMSFGGVFIICVAFSVIFIENRGKAGQDTYRLVREQRRVQKIHAQLRKIGRHVAELLL